MYLTDITSNCDNKVKERIDYVFAAFKKEFVNVLYDERREIVGVGEPNKHLMCYYYLDENGEPWVKFKTGDKICLSADIDDLDLYIDGTIRLFKENNLVIKSKQHKTKTQLPNEKLLFEEVDELIERFDLDKTAIEISFVASRRLTNALNRVKITNISDLQGWSSSRLMKIRNFGFACLEELHEILLNINQAKNLYAQIGKSESNKIVQVCQGKASKESSMRRYLKNKKINDYLETLNFDENNFEERTIGYILCLRKKIKELNNINLCSDKDVLYFEYVKNLSKFSDIYESTKIFLTDIANDMISDELKKEVFFTLAFGDSVKNASKELSEKYSLSNKKIRDMFKMVLIKLSSAFNLNYARGVINCIARENYFKQFENCPFDAFILYLTVLHKTYFVKVIYRVLLGHNLDLEDLRYRINEAKVLLNESQASNAVCLEHDKLLYKNFQLIVSDDGEILTDLELLKELQKERLNIAKKLDIPCYMVYSNKHLVLLATFKPLNKNMYSSIRGFTENTWDKYGCAMVEVIKQYVDKITTNVP